MPHQFDVNAPIAVSMGDPAGIGPEIIVKAWQVAQRRRLPPFVVFGDAHTFEETIPSIPIDRIDDPATALTVFNDALPVINIPLARNSIAGTPSIENAPTIIKCIEAATKACLTSQCKGLVTGPIHKASLYSDGFKFQGHTDFLASLCNKENDAVLMMLCLDDLRVVPLTIHIPLSAVPQTISKPLIIKSVNILHETLSRQFGFQNPRIGVAALNPHAGEENTIGTEESSILTPAINDLRRAGIHVEGPFPADTLFSESFRGRFDAILAMYHDQALVPIKTLNFREAVNVTLGLPIVRTSPDHGTAFDIAGQSAADPESFIQAIYLADRLSNRNHD